MVDEQVKLDVGASVLWLMMDGRWGEGKDEKKVTRREELLLLLPGEKEPPCW